MKSYLWIIIVAIVLIIGGVIYFSYKNSYGGSQSSSNTPAVANQVTMQNFAFSPASMTVKVGMTVTWLNDDSAAHHIKANDGSFESGDIAKGQTFEHIFNQAGTFDYFCAIHTYMKGSIVVEQ